MTCSDSGSVIFDRDKPGSGSRHVGQAPENGSKFGVFAPVIKGSWEADDAIRRVIQARKLEPRIMRRELSDHERAAIKPFLPDKPRGVPRVNDRRVLNGDQDSCRRRYQLASIRLWLRVNESA